MNKELPIKEKASVFFGFLIHLSQIFLAFVGSEVITNSLLRWFFVSAIAFTWLLKFDIINHILLCVGVYLAIVYKYQMDWWVGLLAVFPFINQISIPILLYIIFCL